MRELNISEISEISAGVYIGVSEYDPISKYGYGGAFMLFEWP